VFFSPRVRHPVRMLTAVLAAALVAAAPGAVTASGPASTSATTNAPTTDAARPFSPRFRATDRGSIALVGSADSAAADLALPAGATVLFAGLYWGGESVAPERDRVQFELPGSSIHSIQATDVQAGSDRYAAMADVTGLLAGLATPTGRYRLAGVQATAASGEAACWVLVVAYRDLLTPAPLRSLTVLDGGWLPGAGGPDSPVLTLSGFRTPVSGRVDVEVGVGTLGGSAATVASQALLNGGDLALPADSPGRAFGIDLLDGTGRVANGATSADLAIATPQGGPRPAVLTFAVDVDQPLLTASTGLRDLNGGRLRPGDQVEYSISVTNIGTEPAVDTAIDDPIPTGTIYLPGSLQIASGANAGALTDVAGDDTGWFDRRHGRVVANVGVGAGATTGGRLESGASVRLRFRATVAGRLPPQGRIRNRAGLSYRGAFADEVLQGLGGSTGVSTGEQPVIARIDLGPAAHDDAATTPEDTPVAIAVIANDGDPDGNLVVSSVAFLALPAAGTAAVDARSGVVTYTPDPDWNGVDTFTYRACDAEGACDRAGVTVTVVPVNDQPLVLDDAADTAAGAPVTIDVLANDMDPDGLADLDRASLAITSGGAAGSATVDPASAAVLYSPAAGWSGSDAFTYQVCDAWRTCATGLVAVEVMPAGGAALPGGSPDQSPTLATPLPTPADPTTDAEAPTATPATHAPTARDDTATTAEDTPVTVDPTANDADIDGDLDPLTVNVAIGPGHGAATVDPVTGELTYAPAPDWSGTDTLTYRACDATEQCATASLSVAVAPVNDAPRPSDDQAELDEDASTTVEVLANDTDPDSAIDPASVAIADGPAHGTAVVDTTAGTITYRPDGNDNGPDRLTYQVCDTDHSCAVGHVRLTVRPIADPPLAADDLVVTPEDVPVTFDALANDGDPDGDLDAASVTVVESPGHGATKIDATTATLTYAPDPDWSGTDSLSYRVCDTGSPVACASATVTLLVTARNQLPVARPDAATTGEDVPVAVDVIANDTDRDGRLDPTTVTVSAPPVHGTVSIDATTGLSYAPAPDWNGTDALEYQVCDDELGCGHAQVTLVVTPTPDPPVAAADALTTNEDTAATVDVLANDVDPDGDLDPSTLIVTSAPAHGAGSIEPGTGRVSYFPTRDANGADAFSYRVCDRGAPSQCAEAAVTITVLPVNDPPVALPDAATTPEDVPVRLDLLSNDRDPDGVLGPASVAIVSGPRHGTLTTDLATGETTYVPAADWNGRDALTYRVCDEAGACATAGAEMTVTAVADAPVAMPDRATLLEDSSVVAEVLANDRDPDGPADLDPASVHVVAGPDHGSVSIAPASGAISYSPAADYDGEDVLTYRVCDRTAVPLCVTADLRLVVTPVNDPPVATPDLAATDEDSAVTVDVLANDTDPEGALDPASVAVPDAPEHGATAVDAATGVITYTPAPDYGGSDAFRYRVCDAEGACATAEVSIVVAPLNDPPVALDDAATTGEDVPVMLDVLANDVDRDGAPDPASVTVIGAPGHGSTAVDAPGGSITYTPDADWNGADAFTYRVCDATGACDTAAASIRVLPVADAPRPAADRSSTPEDTSVSVPVLANDTDPDGDLVAGSLAISTPPGHGRATVDPAAAGITYTPDPDWNGTDGLSYRVCDAAGACAVATVTFDVLPVDDPPTIRDQGLAIREDSFADVPILAEASDPDGQADLDPASVRVTDPATHGMAEVDHDTGSIRFTPDADWYGTDTFRYRVCDVAGLCVTAMSVVRVDPVDDPPAPVDDAAVVQVDAPATIDVLANDADADGNLDRASLAVVAAPAHGTASVEAATGRIIYRPLSGYAGTDGLMYRVCDAESVCQFANVMLVAATPGSLTWIGPGRLVVSVPAGAIQVLGAAIALGLALFIETRRRRRAWQRMLRRAAGR
jgi:large repetitive protein